MWDPVAVDESSAPCARGVGAEQVGFCSESHAISNHHTHSRISSSLLLRKKMNIQRYYVVVDLKNGPDPDTCSRTIHAACI